MGHTIGSAVSTGQYDPAEHAVVLDEPMGQYVASGHDCGVGAGECRDRVGGIETINHRGEEYCPLLLISMQVGKPHETIPTFVSRQISAGQ